MSGFTGIWIPKELVGTGLSGTRLHVLGRVLALQEDRRGCFKNNRNLARDLQTSQRSARRHINALVEEHWLEREDVAVSTPEKTKVQRRLYPGVRLRGTHLSGVSEETRTKLSRDPVHMCPPGWDRLYPPSEEVSEEGSEEVSSAPEGTADGAREARAGASPPSKNGHGDSEQQQRAGRRPGDAREYRRGLAADALDDFVGWWEKQEKHPCPSCDRPTPGAEGELCEGCEAEAEDSQSSRECPECGEETRFPVGPCPKCRSTALQQEAQQAKAEREATA